VTTARWDGPVNAGVPEDGAPIPKYYAAKIQVARLLDTIGIGGVVPAERALAQRLGVSRETLRQALQELLVEGRLRREGRHTVVAGPKIVKPLGLASYTEGMPRPGRRLVGRETVEARDALAAGLAVPLGTAVIHLERVLLTDAEAVGLESSYVPLARTPRLLDDFAPDTSLYAYYAAIGIELATADERIETVLATPREAALLGSLPALPMLLLNRTSYDQDGVPVECVRTLFRGDRFSVSTRLVRNR
jgi:GntR family transcriptional regulator